MSRSFRTQSILLCLVNVALIGGLAGCGAMLPFGGEAEAQKAAQERYTKAKALFEERCKSAGVVIKRTVKNVEGIELLKVRPVLSWGDQRYFDPMFDGAAMADEAQGDSYIASFLYNELRNPNTPDIRGVIQPPAVQAGMNQSSSLRGYRYVDVQDGGGAAVLRYRIAPSLTERQWYERGGWAKDFERIVRTGPRAPFAVDYEDIVDPADRAYWIAGTRIKIVDQESGEIIAQLTRFVWDRGFGTSSTGRLPWQHASSRTNNVCPVDVNLPRSYVTRYFVDTVLVPKQGNPP